MNDIQYAFRQFLKNPGFTAIAIVTLGLGIGATTAIFSVVNAVLLRPLPYPEPGQLVQIRKQTPPNAAAPAIGGRDFVGGHEFVAWREQSQTLAHLAAYGGNSVNLSGTGPAERILAGDVTAGFFHMLGVRPLHGRLFLEEEEHPNGPRVAVLSFGLWQRRFGGDPAIIGRTIRLDDVSHEVIGVLPGAFQFPEPHEVWTPMRINPIEQSGVVAINLFRAIARVKQGVALEQAQAELNTIAERANPFAQMRNLPPPPGRGPLTKPMRGAPLSVGPGPQAPAPGTELQDSIRSFASDLGALPGVEDSGQKSAGQPADDQNAESSRSQLPPGDLVQRSAPPGEPPPMENIPSDAMMFESGMPGAPGLFGGGKVSLVPLHEHWVANVRPALLVLFSAVALVLLIGCVNVANLVLARASSRRKEIAVRSALGAQRFRIARQLLAESVVLSLLGGAAGLVVAAWGVGVVNQIDALASPLVERIRIDAVVLGFALAASVLTGLLFGSAPAWQAARAQLSDVLKDASAGEPPQRHRLRGSLIVAETGLALVLLASAGLMLKSFVRLQAIEPGFQPAGLLTFQFNLHEKSYPSPEQRARLLEQTMQELNSLAGVQGAAATDHLPLTHYVLMTDVSVEGRPRQEFQRNPPVSVASVTPNYFQIMGIAIKQGRSLTEADRTSRSIVVNETFARRYFPGESAVGQRLRNFEEHHGQSAALTIVGVVADVRQEALDKSATPELYRVSPGPGAGFVSVALRAQSDPGQLSAAVRARMQAIDSELPIYGVMTMQERLDATTAPRRVYVLLLGSFAALAVVLAAVGIYGVMSFIVSQRTRELGVRMALGARSSDVLQLVVRQGLKYTGAGLCAGFVGAILVTRYLSTLLFEVSPIDPVTYLSVALLLAGIALAACLVPAWRASKVDPMNALRHE